MADTKKRGRPPKKKIEEVVEKPKEVEVEVPVEEDVKKDVKKDVKEDVPPPVIDSYRIVKGKAVSCQKGTLGPGAEVKAEYVGGEDCLKRLIETGHVEKY